VIDYEILLMLDPEVPEERQDEILARTRELIERGGGSWVGHEPWGRRKLAYEIDHKGEGVYHLVTFKSEAVWILILSIAPLTLGLLIAVLLWLIERVFLF